MATRKEIEDAKAKKAAAAKKDDKAQKGQVRLEYNQAMTGLNMDSTINQVKTGSLTYALNATIENFDSSSVNYQNEPGNEPCLSFPKDFQLIGKHTIPEKKKNIFFLVNPSTGQSEIGFMFNNDCQYQRLVRASCLNFNLQNPIHKVVHRITNCTTEIYWTDGLNPRRYLDIDNVPYKIIGGTPNCDAVYGDELDCNQLSIQPDFEIPFLEIENVVNVGSLEAGVYQFAVQYADAAGNDLTSYYSVTNPTPIADPLVTTVNFNYPVGKSIEVKVSNLDLSGQYQYFNLAVIKTINDITSVELVGTYNITEAEEIITYTGADQTAIRLSISDIFEKYPYYDIAQDVTSVQDTLIWSNLTSVDRINYQSIASQIRLRWETYRIPANENYADEFNATNLRGYMRDEVYAFGIVFLLKNGKQTDAFHIPGPPLFNPQPDVPNTNNDFIGEPDYYQGSIGYSPYWKIYNDATVDGPFVDFLPDDPNYKGPWQFGNFAYWESTEKYPCNSELWGDLADQPIRHHKFPDVAVAPIVENGSITYENGMIVPSMENRAIFPIGVKIDNSAIINYINNSNLTQEQKDDIEGYKIVRGDRGTNKSVIAKGILRNVGKYTRDEQEYYYPNYPYNQVSGEDAFLQENNNAWNYKSKSWLVYMPDKTTMIDWGAVYTGQYPLVDIDVNEEEGVFQYTSVDNGKLTQRAIQPNCIVEICSLTRPVALRGRLTIGPGDFDVWRGYNGSGAQRGWYINWYNPFNNFNYDGAVAAKTRICTDWGILNNCYYTSATVITPVDYDYWENNEQIYGDQVVDVPDDHAYKPTASDTSSGFGGFIGQSEERIRYNGIVPGPCTETNEDGEVVYEITYSANSFNPNYPCPDQSDVQPGEPGEACQECIKTENPEGLNPWPQEAFGQPTNPLPEFGGVGTSATDAFPIPRNYKNTLTPAEDINDSGGQAIKPRSSRWSRRSCLKCDRDVPIQPLEGAEYEEVKDLLAKQIFNSPDTSFGQPFLGGVLKLESAMFGAGKAHFVEVKDNAKYKLISKEAQEDALKASERVAAMGSDDFNAGVMFTVYQSYLTIYINGITRKNYAMSFNSRATYSQQLPVYNNIDGGVKQRNIKLARYLIPGVQSFNNNEPPVNNWNRESSVYIDTDINDNILALPLAQNTPELLAPDGTSTMVEYSRFTIGESGVCDKPEKEQDIKVVAYYASMKNIVPNQWGQINSFQRIDTGYQKLVKTITPVIPDQATIFGGDVFISQFAFKTKLPFFIDNRVNAADDSDIFFDELSNVAYAKYWHSARSILSNYVITEEVAGDAGGDFDPPQNLFNIISTKANNFDCPSDPSLTAPPNLENPGDPIAGTFRSFYDGYMYLFAYGIPNFYCESVYNTDLRQAFNNKEGDFWPHVSSGIPDDWVQETNVPIAQDNTYYYNVTYSKQNKENVFTLLPPDWSDLCYTFYPFRAIYSDTQGDSPDNQVNNWLVYRALSFHDFPQNYGNLTSLDGVMDRAVLARFDNKALLYGKLLTIDTSNPQAAYIGNPRLFDGAPPIDFAETDLGYVGSQHKFLLKVPAGAITADAKRGQIFLTAGNKAVDITKFGSGVNRFMTNHLPFEILEYFPEVNVDNHFAGIGLHGVYDSKFERVIITKLDYIPLSDDVYYNADDKKFYVTVEDKPQEVFLFDREYFCSKSWTMSFDFNTKSWISFHSYLPNFYIGENNFYYSGINNCCTIFTAVLSSPDVSKIEDEDPQLDLFVGEVDPVAPITTSTTTTLGPAFTTTTTTAYVPDCDFTISLTEELSCGLDGVGYITVPTPTTTTICSRPSGLQTSAFTEGYQIQGQSPIVNTDSALNACAIGTTLLAGATVLGDIQPITFNFQYQGDTTDLGDSILYFGTRSNCTTVPDGWYTNAATGWSTAYYVSSARVLEEVPCDCDTLTTTTTAYQGGLEECCGFIVNSTTSNNKVYIINPRLPHSVDRKNWYEINIPGMQQNYKLAVGPNTLYAWDASANEFAKWNITTSPWSAVATTSVPVAGFTTDAGVVVKDDNTLIALNTTSGNVVEIDLTAGSITNKFALPAGYGFSTNLLYTTAGKLITVGEVTATGVLHYLQWDYDNAVVAPEIDITITSSEFTDNIMGITECDCSISIVTEGDTVDVAGFIVTNISPFEVVYVGPIENSLWNEGLPTDPISNVTQMQSCVSPAGGITTTTTTTVLSTTTTTTSIYPCYKWEVTGPMVVWYTDCMGIPQVLSVATGETKEYCTNVNVGSEGSLLGSCN